jgi:hypothetical protein
LLGVAALLTLAPAARAQDLSPSVVRFTFTTEGGGSGDCNATSNPRAQPHGLHTIIVGQNQRVKGALRQCRLRPGHANGVAPKDLKESGIFTSLPAGEFTAILAGKDGGTGIGVAL